jgi:DNA polymerase-3 subunit gamma/tau
MMGEELKNKYRPKKLDDVIGNENVLDQFRSRIDQDDYPHAVLFTGPYGCGKTTMGRIYGNILGCGEEDRYEYDNAQFRGIDVAREIRRSVYYAPNTGWARLWLLDEAHGLTVDAQRSILKILEEPPSHAFFVLCTTDPQKLNEGIVSRCARFDLKTLNYQDMRRLLRRVSKGEGKKLPKEVYDQIFKDSFGAPRNALNILGQIIHLPEDKMLEGAKQAAVSQSETIELCQALMQKKGWKKVIGLLQNFKEQEIPPERVRRHVLDYCNKAMDGDQKERAYLTLSAFADRNTYDIGHHALILSAFEAFFN